MATSKKSKELAPAEEGSAEVVSVGEGIEEPQEERYISPEMSVAMSGEHVVFDMSLPQNEQDQNADNENTED